MQLNDYELFSLLGLFEKMKAEVLGIVVIVIKKEARNQATNKISPGHELCYFCYLGKTKTKKCRT